MQGSGHIKTILIIEDDPFISMDLEDIFESEGFKVLGPYAEVQPGLKVLEDHKPDVAMLDYNLGSETSVPIAKELDSKNIPYAFLSGQIKTVIMDKGTRPQPVILKPFIPEKLIGMVHELMK